MLKNGLLTMVASLLLAAHFAFAQEDVLVVTLSSDPTSLYMPRAADRTAGNASWSLYDTLVWLNEEGELVPQLATDWQISDDGLTYTFTLRQGVTFHNGEPFTADDVIATWEYGGDDSNDYPGYYTVATSVEAIDDFTVRITTAEPNAIFLTTMAKNWAIIPGDYMREVGIDAFAAAPVGTGPFQFVSRTPGERIVMEANPNYWDPALPYLDGVEYRVISDPSTRVAAIQTGAVHIANRLTPELAESLEGEDGVDVLTYLNDRVYYVAFKNIGAGVGTPLEDARVRQALNYGVDRFGIIEAIFSGYANPAPGFVVEGNLGYDEPAMAPFAYDPERARALLAEAGYPDGFDIQMGCPADGYVNINEVCQAVAQSLGAIGVNVDVDFQTTNTYWSEPQYAVTGPMFVDSWSSEVGEALPRLQGALIPGNYYTTWEDSELEALINQIDVTVDRDERAALYQEMHERMRNEPPFIYLYQPVIFEAVASNVQGYRPLAAEEYFLRSVRLAD